MSRHGSVLPRSCASRGATSRSPGNQYLVAEKLDDLLDFSPNTPVYRTALGRETADAFLAKYTKWLEAVTAIRAKATRARKA